MSELFVLIFFIWGCIAAVVHPDEITYAIIFLTSAIWAVAANVWRVYSVFKDVGDEEIKQIEKESNHEKEV